MKERNSTTVTQEKAYWSLPPSLKNIEYMPANRVDFSPPAVMRKLMEKSSMDEIDTQAREGTSRSKQISKPSNLEVNEFLKKVHETGTKSVILSLVAPYSDNFVPASSNVSLPRPLTELCNKTAMEMDEYELRLFCKTINVSITGEQAAMVEEITRGQAESKLWYKYRAGLITASKMKMACNTDINNPSVSLIKSICYPFSSKFTSQATSWGITHEATAKREFVSMQNSLHENFSVEATGLCINPSVPYIGATPDGITKCNCCPRRILEIKCPFNHRDKKLEEQEKFYLKRNKFGHLELDNEHEYYFQIQTQLGVCELEEAFFVVWTNQSLHVEIIKYNRDHWICMTGKAERLFNSAILLELVGKFFSLRKHKKVCTAPLKICYCNEEIGKYSIITCNRSDCNIKYFHQSCIFFDETPPKKARWLCSDCKDKTG